MMNWIRRILNVFRTERLTRDIQREMAFHVAERTDALVAAGAAPAEAARQARRQLGHATTQREGTRDVDVATVLDSVVGDVRYAVRALRRTPGYTAVAVLSLALGIGANTAIFSVVNAVVLRTLPIRDPEQLTQITLDGSDFLTNPIWEQLRDRQSEFGQALAFGSHGFAVISGGESHRLDGTWVSGDYFSVLGVGAILGRPIARGDDWRGCPPVAMLSYGYWQSEFGGRADVLGRPLMLDSHAFQIVGVAQPGFDGLQVGFASRVFVPICAEPISRGGSSALDRRSSWWLNIMARPSADMSLAALQARLTTVTPQVLAATLPQRLGANQQRNYLSRKLLAAPAPNGLSPLRKRYGHALYVLLGAVGLVLLIACANVANLLLARAAAREHELAIRSALGAGRSRIIRQLMAESTVLALSGAVLGVVLARVTSGALMALFSGLNQSVTLALPLDARVLGFTLGVAVLTGLIFGIAPAWRSALISPRASLAMGRQRSSASYARLTPAKLLVAAQVALLLPLLAGAGLMIGTLRNLTDMDPGFDPRNVVLMNIDAARATGIAPEQRSRAYEDILARLQAIPGVTAASASDVTPVGTSFWNDLVSVAGYAPATFDDSIVDFNEVSPGYFATMRTPLTLGRDFTAEDGPGSPRVAIVNESMARKFFGGRNPIGQTMRIGQGPHMSPPVRVVGVVADTKYQSLREAATPIAYLALRQDDSYDPGFNFEMRTAGGVNAVRTAALAAVKDVNPGITASLTTLSDQLSRSLGLERVLARLSAIFGVLALGLAMIGLYGVMAYSVVRRRAEIGIRLALGASASGVRRLVLSDVARVVALGVIVGLGAAIFAMRTLTSVVYGVSPTDPRTMVAAVTVLAVIAAIAGYLPARRASREDPMLALRQE
jgi:predicted permease